MKDCLGRVLWLTLALCVAAAAMAVAATEVKTTVIVKSGLVEKVGNGEIDWGKEMFYAQGQGAMASASEEPSRAKAFLSAREYAKMEAIANMRMLIDGCSISYEATGKDFMVQDATLRQKIEGYVKNVKIFKTERVKEGDDTIVIVTVGCKMYGNDTPGAALLQKMSELTLQSSWVKSVETPSKPVKIDVPGQPTKIVEVKPETPPPTEEKPAEVKPPETEPVEPPPVEVKAVEKPTDAPPVEVKAVEKPVEEKPNPPTPPKVAKPFTGVIINTLGLHVYRAMSPKIRKQSGVEVWGTLKMDPDEIQDHGPVAYTRTIAEAKKSPRSGPNPLVIKAIGRAGGMRMCDVVLDEAAVSKLKMADECADPSFLARMNVVLVVDPVQIL